MINFADENFDMTNGIALQICMRGSHQLAWGAIRKNPTESARAPNVNIRWRLPRMTKT